MQYIAAVSGKSEEVVRVKDIILESNPLLEVILIFFTRFINLQRLLEMRKQLEITTQVDL